MELKHKLLKLKASKLILLLIMLLSGQISVMGQCTANASFNGSLTGCSTVQFSDLSSAAFGYTIVAWDWDFGDGNTSNVQHPLHVYTPGSPYIVTLTATADSSGTTCQDSYTSVVTVPGLPTVYVTWDPETTCLGGATSFFGTSGNPIVTWNWDFGDGLSSSIQNPVHLYVLPGIYTVTLLVTDVNGCSDTSINQVTIAAIPDVDFTFSPDPTCLNSITSFYGTSSAAVTSWTWNFGDGGVGFTQNAIHTYLSPGTYTATLTIDDTSGCTNSVSYPVTVNPLPTANFFSDSPTCSNDSVNFTNISTSPNGYIAQWIWDFGDGTSTTINFPGDPNVTHFYPNPGTFQVTLTVTDSDSCTNSTQRNVIIVAKPLTDFTFTSACNGQPVSFTDLSTPNGGNSIVSWYWEFDDPSSGVNNTSNLQNPSHLFISGNGPYSVLLIVTNTDGCTDSITKPVSINGLPVVDITTDADTVCVNAITDFYGSGSSNIVTWFWTFGDGGTSVLQNPQHVYSSPGAYNVTLTAFDDQGCDSTATHTMRVNALPFADFNTSSPSCENSPVDFFNLSSAPGGWVTEWHWYFGDGTDTIVLFPDPPNVSHTYTSQGSYIASLAITSNASCIDSISHQVVVALSPQAGYSVGGPMCEGNLIQFFDESQGFGSTIQAWNWNFGDPSSGGNNNSTLQNPFHLFTSFGTFTVWLEVTNANGCTDSISTQIEILEPPSVFFNVSPDAGVCQNEAAFFTVNPDTTNILAVVSYLWNFGDPSSGANNVSTLASPEHLFTTFGTFDVTLSIVDTNGCSNSIILPVEVLKIPTANYSFTPGCFGDSTFFMDQSLPGATVVNKWFWKFNDLALAPGDTSNLQNPGFMFSSIDNYFVELTVSDINGCSQTFGQWIEVFDTPKANYTFNQFCNPPGLVQFNDESTYGASGSPLQSWFWEIDEGFFSSEINPAYIYSDLDSCYIVNLTVTDENLCTDTYTDTICLFGQLEIDFTATQVCYRETTNFESSFLPASDSVATWKWNFGDGSPVLSTQYDTIAHVFPTPGVFLVTLNATDENGCTASTYQMVTVDSLPSPDFVSSIAFCDTPTSFTDLSTGNGTFIQSWFWDFGDYTSTSNTSTIQYPTHTYAADDSTYFVTLRISNYLGCYDSIIKPVYKGPCISADFEAVDPPFCSTYPTCFVNNSEFYGSTGGIYQWEFIFGDGGSDIFTSRPDTICHVFDDPGSYMVTFVIVADVNGNLYSDTAKLMVEISPTPTSEFISTFVCANEETLFKSRAEGNGGNVMGWEWNFGDLTSDDDTSTLENPGYKYPYAGVFDVELIVTSDNGCIDTLVKEIEIYEPPVADFSSTNACVNEYTEFFDESIMSGADIYSWEWSFGDSQSTADTSVIRDPSYTYQSTGIFTVTLMIEDLNQCRDTIDKTVTVHVVPDAGFTITDNYQGIQGQIYLDNQSSGAEFYEWDFDNGETSQEENPVVAYTNDGTYLIELIAINEFGCPDTIYLEYEILFKGLFIPSAFVPQGAEELRYFRPQGINIKRYSIAVYNLWGNLLWSSERLTTHGGRPLEAWNGHINNDKNEELMPSGNYVWKVSATFIDNTVWKGMDDGNGNFRTSGTVTLIR